MTTEQRLSRLERSVRAWRIVCIALAVALSAGLLMAAQENLGDIRARSVHVIGDDGVASVLIKPGGIMVYGPSRKDGPMMTLIAIAEERGGGSQIFMHNAKGERGVNIVAQKKGEVHTW